MQLALLRREIDGNGLGFARGELTDVPAPCTVDEGTERVELLNSPRERNPVCIAEIAVLKSRGRSNPG